MLDPIRNEPRFKALLPPANRALYPSAAQATVASSVRGEGQLMRRTLASFHSFPSHVRRHN